MYQKDCVKHYTDSEVKPRCPYKLLSISMLYDESLVNETCMNIVKCVNIYNIVLRGLFPDQLNNVFVILPGHFYV